VHPITAVAGALPRAILLSDILHSVLPKTGHTFPAYTKSFWPLASLM
jgi:hypothetical protein